MRAARKLGRFRIDGGPTDLNNLTLLCRYHHTHFLQKAGPARSTPTVCPNGYRPDGSTQPNHPNSTPASAASTPNTNSADGDDQPRPPEGDVDYCGLPDIRQAVGPGWMGLRTDRQYADQPD